MKYPIPRPKQITYTDGTVPASFFAKEFDPIFADALNVFQNYVLRAFGDIDNTDSSLILRLDPTLDDGYRITIQKETVITASDNAGMNYAVIIISSPVRTSLNVSQSAYGDNDI